VRENDIAAELQECRRLIYHSPVSLDPPDADREAALFSASSSAWVDFRKDDLSSHFLIVCPSQFLLFFFEFVVSGSRRFLISRARE
jgi:hypothetical protein